MLKMLQVCSTWDLLRFKEFVSKSPPVWVDIWCINITEYEKQERGAG